MARSIKSKKLDSRTARRSISQGKITHWMPVSRGRALGYRRGQAGGTWVARFDAENLRREQKLGESDDVHDSDGVQILDFTQALEKANKFFCAALTQATGESPRGGPYTVNSVAQVYLKSLENRGAPDHRARSTILIATFFRNLGPLMRPNLREQNLKHGARRWPSAHDCRRRSTEKINCPSR